MTPPTTDILGLGPRVHLFVQPSARESFTALFRDVLRCNVVEREVGLVHPVLFVGFGDGSGFSVEFTDLAPADVSRDVDDRRALRGAWIEFRTRDVEAVHAALRAAGIAEFRHTGSSRAYFVAPGGQVFRILDVDDTGP